ncbi:hypothetical protein LXL04_020302 [Taraxacum kok-saghyz]
MSSCYVYSFSVRSKIQMKLVEFSFPVIYTDVDKQIEELKKALYMMYEEYVELHDLSVKGAASPGTGSGGSVASEKTPLGSRWEAFGEFIKNADLEKPEKSELDAYLEEGVYRDQGKKGMDSFKALEWSYVGNAYRGCFTCQERLLKKTTCAKFVVEEKPNEELLIELLNTFL